MRPGKKRCEISGDTSRDNRSLDESRVEEINRLMKNLTPKTKSGLGHALIKDKQQDKSSESPVQFTAATGGASECSIVNGDPTSKVVSMGNKTCISVNESSLVSTKAIVHQPQQSSSS